MNQLNYLSPIEFEVAVTRLPAVSFFVQRLTIPGVSGSPAVQHTPLNQVYHSSDELAYDPLSLSFVVDEKMTNYLEVLNWLTALTFPQSSSQFKTVSESRDGLYSDIRVLVKNSHKNPNVTVTFVNVQPTSLSDVSLDATQTNLTYPTATATFAYDYFTVEVQ